MPEAAFIVEGVQEQNIVRRLCPNSKAVLLQLNGDAVQIKQIAKKIESFFRIFNNKYYPIFVIFDRENRKETHEEIVRILIDHLTDLKVPLDQFVIGVADRKIESWIAPFIDLDGSILSEAKQSYDEINCLGVLTERLKESGNHYHKSTTGCHLFCNINPVSLAKISPSFKHFYDQAKLHCSWLNVFT